jgi:phytanoyl-CoA hydroxylase
VQPARDPQVLTEEQVASFSSQGYLVVPGWWSEETMAGMREAAAAIVRDFDASTVSVFSTNEQMRTSDDYFLGSGDKVRCFFEERAFNADGSLKRAKETCINKARDRGRGGR